MSQTTILICESDAIMALDLQQIVHGMEYGAPVIVSTGEEAVKAACSMNPSLVLSEVQLSGKLDGIAAASLIRSRLDVPIVYLTCDPDHETLQRARATRPYGFLLKPFSTRQLQVTIDLALHNHKSDLMVNHVGKSRCGSASSMERMSVGTHSAPPERVQDLPTPRRAEIILPICSGCKQIRDHSGSWRQFEEYLRDHFDLLFTHSLCPECVKLFTPRETCN
jgi:CheY-like chemotaxis protein